MARWSTSEVEWFESAHQGQERSAVGTAGLGCVGKFGSGFADLTAEQGAHQQTSLAGRATEPTKVADPHEAVVSEISITTGISVDQSVADARRSIIRIVI